MLVVEDVITTGGSVTEVVQLIESLGNRIVGVGSLIDRSAGSADFGYPFHSLLSLPLQAYNPTECPLCRAGEEIIKPGSKKQVT